MFTFLIDEHKLNSTLSWKPFEQTKIFNQIHCTGRKWMLLILLMNVRTKLLLYWKNMYRKINSLYFSVIKIRCVVFIFDFLHSFFVSEQKINNHFIYVYFVGMMHKVGQQFLFVQNHFILENGKNYRNKMKITFSLWPLALNLKTK